MDHIWTIENWEQNIDFMEVKEMGEDEIRSIPGNKTLISWKKVIGRASGLGLTVG